MMMNIFDLSNKVAIVTGGAGILGRKFCAALAAQGAKVAMVDINLSDCESTINEILKSNPDLIIKPFFCDVSNPDSVGNMLENVIDSFGAIDILLNNAASKTSDLDAFFAPYEEYSINEWRNVMAVNIDGMFLVSQAVGKHLVQRNCGGSIVQVASIYGVVAPDHEIYQGSNYLGRQINTPAVYSASKAAVIGLSKYLASYWAKNNIRVNSISPGGVDSGQNEKFKKLYSEKVPLGRMAHADDLVGAAIFLAADASGYITGQNLIVDGGFTCW